MEVWIPGFSIPEVKVTKGQLLNVSILSVGLVIPPFDITFFPGLKIWDKFQLFDSEWINKPIISVLNVMKLDLLGKIPQLVWNTFEGRVNTWVEDFYERRGKEKS